MTVNQPIHAASADTSTPTHTERIIFAGGCFWCVEGVFDQLNGVISAESGYCGGSKESANYKQVCSGASDHAEVVAITFDPRVISLTQLFEVFFKTHNPTQLNKQGHDVGTQYRSAIFYANDAQKAAARAFITDLTVNKEFSQPIVTTLEALHIFYPAESYHQNYVSLNPGQGYVRSTALPKIRKACTLFPHLIKKNK